MSKQVPHPNVPAVNITDVTFVYPGSEQPVLNGASLTIGRGSFTAIIGGNGCGKSTLCKLFNGLIPHYYSGDFTGTVEICGLSAEKHTVSELSRMVGYVYQDFDNQLVRPTVLDEAVFAPLNYGLAEYQEMGSRALELCGLTHLKDRYIWELSGGQKHLLALAGALSLEPDILVVDEPVSQLDPQHARQVYDVLRQLNRVHGKTIIVIEHHTEFIADYCEEVCLMEQGTVRWQRPVAEALNSLEDLERLGIQPPEVTKAAVQLAVMLNRSDMAADRPLGAQPMPTGSESGSRAAGFAESPIKQPYPITAEAAEIYFRDLLTRQDGHSQMNRKPPAPGANDDALFTGLHTKRGIPEPLMQEEELERHRRPSTAGREDVAEPFRKHSTVGREDVAEPFRKHSTVVREDVAEPFRRHSTVVREEGAEPFRKHSTVVREDLAGPLWKHSTAVREDVAEPFRKHSTVVQLNQAALRYRTIRKVDHEVLRGIDLSLHEGERIALVGNNGAGKSSLLKLIAGIAKPSSGSVEIMGQSTALSSMEQISSKVAYVFQNPEDMFIEDSVYKEVAYGLTSRHYPEAEDRANRMLAHFRLEPFRERDARLLSGGQQRRVSLAIGSAMMPHLILLDEPTANLDLATREELLGTLKELEQQVRTVIIATHDMQLVHQWATRVIVLHHGMVAGDGSAADIFADPALIHRAGLAPTQMMDLSARLGINPPYSSPTGLAQHVYAMMTEQEGRHDAARPQLV
ncbi:ABC transporter ATP-binding protein [Paenibacillus glucanolyticus]|nr:MULTISPECIES: ABC transporter ATP-binding protein [Paenibacillus]ANA80489.1 ABC transporter [Paenibacillus glucanolyticus]AVV55441.1 ABC transporter ATP-binding protein [Paenibacillus glucanolyticus]ETT43652.1 ABC transporter-like protein [Paenibacillus sp. FSL R5-808]MPY15756.1 ABC transporter ATP-binding protein [Paenibacillus glucanolyticus]